MTDYEKYREHVLGPGPKRILALDGGGIRGYMTVQMLKRLEQIIRDKTGKSDILLRDYFHLLGGTSTGAILASAIAIGKTAEELDGIYRELGPTIFKRSFWRQGIFRAKFGSKAINESLHRHFGDTLIRDTSRAGVGLGIVTKRVDTNSTWIVDNNPDGKYFAEGNGDNGGYLLKQIVRASTAAPHFFDPEIIRISKTRRGKFVDGGVSPHNLPALQLFMLATMKGYRYHWETGADKLYILSLGTGSWNDPQEVKTGRFRFKVAAVDAVTSLAAMMNDAAELNQTMLQWFGEPVGPYTEIDRIMGTLEDDTIRDDPLFSYARHDVVLEKGWLTRQLGLNFSDKEIRRLRQMDVLDTMDLLQEIGEKYAQRVMLAEHVL